MKKNLIIIIVMGIFIIIITIGIFYFNQLSSDYTSNSRHESSIVSSQSKKIKNSNEDTLFNNYISCMADCRKSSGSESCIENTCYPPLYQGIKKLGYNSSQPDEDFVSKLNTQNKAFVSCSKECDYLENEAESKKCLDRCFLGR